MYYSHCSDFETVLSPTRVELRRIKAIMESSGHFFNESFTSNHTQANEEFGVPLFVTYIGMVTSLITATMVITPAVVIFNVIWYTRELHTKYYFFVANLLATNITSAIVAVILGYLLSILYLLDFNSTTATIAVKWLGIAPFIILYFMTILSPIPVALERMIVIAFPFRHRSIMTNKTVAGMIVTMWGASTILTIIIILTVPLDIVWPLATLHWHTNIYAIIAAPRLLAVICIVAANSFLHYKITISNRKAEENQRLRNEEQVKKFKRLLKEIRAQAKPTITLFLVGGIDILADIVLTFAYAAIEAYVEPNMKLYVLRFSFEAMESCVFLSQILVYGYYMKKIRNRLPNWMVCYRRWFVCRNRVGILHQQPQRRVNNVTV